MTENEMFPLGSEGRIRQWKSLLILTDIQISDSGTYKCSAVNSVGDDSALTSLRVSGMFNRHSLLFIINLYA